MAEIMILVLFALLLIWMIGLKDREQLKKERDQLLQAADLAKIQTDAAQHRIVQLQEELIRFTGSADRANAFSDQFRELVLAKERIAELQREVSSLRESSKIMEVIAQQQGRNESKVIAEVEQRLKIADRLLKAVKQKQEATSFFSEKELSDQVASLLLLQEKMRATGGGTPADILRIIEENRRKAEDADSQVKTLQGRLLNIQQKLSAEGKGTEKPACWANAVTGKPEYIFEISLKTSSVLIHDNALPHRERQQAQLPLAGLTFDRPLGFSEFRAATRPLFQWSEKERCRFFVHVIDETPAHEKAKYKFALRIVQEHFYTFEDVAQIQ